MIAHEDAERGLLGACMSIENPHAFTDVGAIVRPEDWYMPRHEMVWQAIAALRDRGIPPDPVLVLEELTKSGDASRAGGAPYLHTLYQAACDPVSLQHYARMVADAATMRRLEIAGKRIAQRADTADVDPAELTAWAAEQITAARDVRAGVDVLTVGWSEFVHAVPEHRRMVVPGLLGEGDRVVLTGSGGLGKSTLLMQIAVCAAAGLPPLDYQTEDPTDPVKVTVFDCENPDHRRKNRMWPMVQACRNLGLDPRPNLTLGGHGYSFDLLNPVNALSLLRTIEHDKPDLVYIGPAYKLHNDDPDKESVVKKITGVLDSIREMGVALLTEAHPNKGSKGGGAMSPSGSALWEWWPEYGLGLRLDPDSDEVVRRCKLERWRIDREDSAWPLYVQASGDPGLPWERAAIMPGTFAASAAGEMVGGYERF